jgi:hypothetical protein
VRRSNGRGCWRWDQEKEEGRGGDRRQQWPKREEGNPGQSVPGVTGAQVSAPQGMWHQGTIWRPYRPQWALGPLGAVRILPTKYWAGALRGWARRHPALPIASPQTHSHTTVPRLDASPCQPGQGAALIPAPSSQGDQVDSAGLRGIDRWGEL